MHPAAGPQGRCCPHRLLPSHHCWLWETLTVTDLKPSALAAFQAAKFRAVPLNPIVRPRVPKPYFPAPGPFKIGRGRFECIRVVFCIEFAYGNSQNHCTIDKIQTIPDSQQFGRFFYQPFGKNTFSQSAAKSGCCPWPPLAPRRHGPLGPHGPHVPLGPIGHHGPHGALGPLGLLPMCPWAADHVPHGPHVPLRPIGPHGPLGPFGLLPMLSDSQTAMSARSIRT